MAKFGISLKPIHHKTIKTEFTITFDNNYSLEMGESGIIEQE